MRYRSAFWKYLAEAIGQMLGDLLPILQSLGQARQLFDSTVDEVLENRLLARVFV